MSRSQEDRDEDLRNVFPGRDLVLRCLTLVVKRFVLECYHDEHIGSFYDMTSTSSKVTELATKQRHIWDGWLSLAMQGLEGGRYGVGSW